MVPITFCPPHAASGTAPDPQFHKLAMPISTMFDAHGQVRSNGIGFEEYGRMQSSGGRVQHWRKIKPLWIRDTDKFREVVTRMVEHRAGFFTAQLGTHQQRIDRAQNRLNRSRDNKIGLLDKLCERYIAAKAAGEPTGFLAQKIEEADTSIAHLDRAAALVTAILFLSYRAELNSVDVSAILVCVKPPLVRQTCYRARKLAERIFSGEELRRKQGTSAEESSMSEHHSGAGERSWLT
jgi:hypothetical protein